MSDLFDKVKQRLSGQHNHQIHYAPNLVGDSVEYTSIGHAHENHEAFKALCEEVDKELYQIKKLVVVMEEVMTEQRKVFLQLQENLFEKGFITKDEMVIK